MAKSDERAAFFLLSGVGGAAVHSWREDAGPEQAPPRPPRRRSGTAARDVTEESEAGSRRAPVARRGPGTESDHSAPADGRWRRDGLSAHPADHGQVRGMAASFGDRG